MWWWSVSRACFERVADALFVEMHAISCADAGATYMFTYTEDSETVYEDLQSDAATDGELAAVAGGGSGVRSHAICRCPLAVC